MDIYRSREKYMWKGERGRDKEKEREGILSISEEGDFSVSRIISKLIY
jgi:hypothetical protein